MPKDFYTRLREYYSEVAKVLRGDANAASVFPNPTDVGIARKLFTQSSYGNTSLEV
ncbi:MAG: hypothetical protein R3C02_15175 [Planctomycetaceae bacterium]